MLSEAEELEMLELEKEKAMAQQRPQVGEDPVSSGVDRLKEATRKQRIQEMTHSPTEFLSSRDPEVDYATGVPDFGFRAGFSRMTNDAEKENYLNQSVGEGNWGKDSFGAYTLNPEGGDALNLAKKLKFPTAIDEQTMSRYDLADVAGDLPAVGGAIAGGMAATGLGVIPAAGMAALSAAGGSAIDEIVKNMQGLQRKSPGEVATHLTKEAALAGTGEGVARGAAAVGRYAMAPQARRMTPERVAGRDTATGLGFKVRPGQVTDAPILSRAEGMLTNIFGDLNAPGNAKVAERQLDRLLQEAGRQTQKGDIAPALAEALKQARKTFGARADQMYGVVDDMVGGQPIVSSAPIKRVLAELAEEMPKNAKGEPVFVTPELGTFFSKYGDLADKMTVKQAQQLRTMFRESGESGNLVPGVDHRMARMLKDSVDEGINTAEAPFEAITALKEADKFYKQGITKFDDYMVTSITRDAGKRGAVDPDMVLEYMVKPGMANRVRRIKTLVPDQVWEGVRRGQAERMLSKAVRESDAPLGGMVFDGKAMRAELDKYGRDTLEAIYGKEWVNDAFKLADTLRLVEHRTTLSGGIVAANIALHPLKNLPKLVRLRILGQFMTSPGGLKYLTTGIEAPKTRAGAMALARVSSQLAALMEDETGSAAFTVTDPVAPQPQTKVTPPQRRSTDQEKPKRRSTDQPAAGGVRG